MKSELSLYHKNIQAGISVEKGPSSLENYEGSNEGHNISTPDDDKGDSPNSGGSNGSFSIDDIRAEFEGFDGFD